MLFLLSGATAGPQAAFGIGFSEALQRAARLPQHRADAAALTAREVGDKTLPSRWGNPELQMGLGPGFGAARFTDPGVEWMGVVQQPWQLTNSAAARQKAAEAERAALRVSAERRLLERHLATADAWLALYAAEQLLAARREELVAATELAAAVGQAAKRGAATAADAAEAALAAASRRSEVLAAEGLAWHAASTLASHIELPVAPTSHTEIPVATSGTPPVPELPRESEWPVWLARAAALPVARERQVLADAARLKVGEIRAAAGSSLILGGQAQRNATDQWQFYALIGLRWSRSDQGQRAASQASADATLAAGEAADATRSARLALQLALHEVAHSREAEATLRDEVLPAAETLVSARSGAAARGAATTVDVLRAREARLRARMELLVASGERQRAELAAWLLLTALAPARSTPE